MKKAFSITFTLYSVVDFIFIKCLVFFISRFLVRVWLDLKKKKKKEMRWGKAIKKNNKQKKQGSISPDDNINF